MSSKRPFKFYPEDDPENGCPACGCLIYETDHATGIATCVDACFEGCAHTWQVAVTERTESTDD